jgi:hypothetical protein
MGPTAERLRSLPLTVAPGPGRICKLLLSGRAGAEAPKYLFARPERSVMLAGLHRTHSHDLACGVDAPSLAEVPTEGAQIVHASIPMARPADKSLIAFMALALLRAPRVMPTRVDDLDAPVRHAPRPVPLSWPWHFEARDHPTGLPSSGIQAGHPRGRTSPLLPFYGNLDLIRVCPSHHAARPAAAPPYRHPVPGEACTRSPERPVFSRAVASGHDRAGGLREHPVQEPGRKWS